MKPRSAVYQYTNKSDGITFFATTEDAKKLMLKIGFGGWKREYVSEAWQITGEAKLP